MTRRVLRRLAALQPGEIRFRARESARISIEALEYSRGATWDHRRLARNLAGDGDRLRAARLALEASDWPAAHAALLEHFRARPSRFPLDPRSRDLMAAVVSREFPGAVADASDRAGRLLQGRYDLLGYQDLCFRTAEGDVDWQFDPVHGRRAPRRFWRRVPFLDPELGDHKIIWELNRHQHWLALGRAAWLTGDRRYGRRIVGELESWLRANPPLAGINWSSMLELAIRSLSWIWALHFLAGMDDGPEEPHDAWLIALLPGLERQLEHVSRHLSLYFSPNTHLIGEALSLYVAGRVLPELAAASRWESRGRQLLLGEIDRQVLPDGGHVERSTHYHRYTLDFYLLALAVARRTSDPVEPTLAEAVGRLAWFCRSMADGNGRLPRIGDDDGGSAFPICGRDVADVRDSLAIAAALLDRPQLAIGAPPEEARWFLGPDAVLPQPAGEIVKPQLFPDTGYAAMRTGSTHGIVDVGPHGFLNGGHAHADALSIVLSADGTPLLIDPGTATYTMDAAARDRFRSSAMHNTCEIDGRPQSEPDGPFHWRSRADARVECWRVNEAFQYLEASHDGYPSCLHRRAILAMPDAIWVVADHLIGPGDRTLDVHWHFDPCWEWDDQTGSLRASRPGGARHADIVSTGGTGERFVGDGTGLGWCSPVYGLVIPSPTVRFRTRLFGPATVVTALAWAGRPLRLGIRAAEVAVAASGWHVGAAVVTRDDHAWVTAFATPVSSSADSPGVYRVKTTAGVLETDARAVALRLGPDGAPASVSLVGASRLAWDGAGPLQLSLESPAEDLHLQGPALRRPSRRGIAEIETSSQLG